MVDDLVEGLDGGVGIDGERHDIGERLTGVFVDDVENLDRSPSSGDIELVVESPHMIRTFGAKPICWRCGLAEAPAFAPLGRHPQALFSPQTLDLLAIHRPAGVTHCARM